MPRTLAATLVASTMLLSGTGCVDYQSARVSSYAGLVMSAVGAGVAVDHGLTDPPVREPWIDTGKLDFFGGLLMAACGLAIFGGSRHAMSAFAATTSPR